MQQIQIPRGYRQSKSLQHKLRYRRPEQWERYGRERYFRLFHDMANRIPAFKDFLKKNSFDPDKIKSVSALKVAPSTEKDNYLRKYPRHLLCWDGEFGEGSWVVSTTSGSTGEPYYFPRQNSQDVQYAVVAEQYLLSNFDIDKKKTLYIVGFPMGAWIGGVFTYEAIKSVAEKGYDMTLITPGIHKEGIIKAVINLKDDFDQIIIGAYAPFLRDILEDGEAYGINWKEIDTKFVFSAETFSENFRDYVNKKVKLNNIYKDTLNHYGTVDLGTMAHETPLTILIRRKLADSKQLDKLFPEKYKQPTLCQYDPTMFYFEQEGNNLICSAYSGIPLFRYNLKDYGGVITYKTMKSKLSKLGINIDADIKKLGLENTHWKLPFVYVYERNDLSVSYYAFNVYPEPVRKALMDEEFNSNLTGKFTMYVDYNNHGKQRLCVVVEKTRNCVETDTQLRKRAVKAVHDILMRESNEYPETYRTQGVKTKPVILFKEYEDAKFFKPGTKQRWIIK